MLACDFRKRSLFLIVFAIFLSNPPLFARPVHTPYLSARSAVVIDPRHGNILFSKNPDLKLPPASTTKLMTAILALEKLSLDQPVLVSPRATRASPSKAGLTTGAKYSAKDLIAATLVSSSNDAAVALAEAAAGSEDHFTELMNAKAKAIGMDSTHFVNCTGLTDKRKPKQYTTAYDLARLMQYAARDERIDSILGITNTTITGSDGKPIVIKNHNKMLWRRPKFVKGKTGWTFASRHTFVGTNYDANKKIFFALLFSKKPWVDIERLATFGLFLERRR